MHSPSRPYPIAKSTTLPGPQADYVVASKIKLISNSVAQI